jgi:hypothetical protein
VACIDRLVSPCGKMRVTCAAITATRIYICLGGEYWHMVMLSVTNISATDHELVQKGNEQNSDSLPHTHSTRVVIMCHGRLCVVVNTDQNEAQSAMGDQYTTLVQLPVKCTSGSWRVSSPASQEMCTHPHSTLTRPTHSLPAHTTPGVEGQSVPGSSQHSHTRPQATMDSQALPR